MAGTPVYRAAGASYVLSVGNTQHAAIAIPSWADQANYAMFINTGTTQICVVVAQYASIAATPIIVFPVDGTPTTAITFIVPNTGAPYVFAVPAGGFCVSAIGNAAGPSPLYITPIAYTS